MSADLVTNVILDSFSTFRIFYSLQIPEKKQASFALELKHLSNEKKFDLYEFEKTVNTIRTYAAEVRCD